MTLLCWSVLLGCGSTPSEGSDELTEEVTQSYFITNGSKSTGPVNPTRFCRMSFMQGIGAHQSSVYWPNGHAKYGMSVGEQAPTLSAFPTGGTASGAAVCNDFADFGFGPAASQTSDALPPYLLWAPNNGGAYVYGTTPLWNWPASFCFLASANGMSHASEDINVYPDGSQWTLGAYGVPTLGASAKCVFPDRAWSYQSWHVNSGGMVYGPLVGNSFCAPGRIIGNLDDGWVRIQAELGRWKMEASGVTADFSCMVW